MRRSFVVIAFALALAGAAASVVLAQEPLDEPGEDRARDIVEEQGGPGGCASLEECAAYCDIEENHDECSSFGEDHGLIPDQRREERTGPGGCNDEEQCRTYCSASDHTTECVQFGLESGNLTQEQADRILQMVRRGEEHRIRAQETRQHGIDEEKAERLIATIGGPGGCSTMEECRAFCDDEANSEACFAYAKEHDLFSGGDIERIEKLMRAEGPGGCRGRACEAYCEAPGHERECVEFGEKSGLIPAEHVAEIKKFLDATEDGGPGGCRGRECERYCQDESRRDECFAFAKERGLLPQEELERFENLRRFQKEEFEQFAPGAGIPEQFQRQPQASEPLQMFEERFETQQFWESAPHEFQPTEEFRPAEEPTRYQFENPGAVILAPFRALLGI